MVALRGLLLLFVVVEVGCAGLRSRVACPSEGGKPWREARSEHFRVLTDLNAEAAEQTARELERFRRGLLLAWDAGFDPPGEVEALVLRHPDEFEEFYGDKIAGLASWSGSRPTLVMSGAGYLMGDAPGDTRVEAHELTHYLSHFALPRQPLWFAEGFATYLETIQFKGSVSEVILGRPHRGYLASVRQHGWLSLEELWAWHTVVGQSQAELERAYASSWLWLHYLINMHPEPFADFEARLAQAQEPRQAFEAAFQGVKDLAGGLRVYVDTGRYAILTVPVPEVPSSVEQRELGCADIHTVRARLRLMGPGVGTPAQRQQQAEEELARALREDPAHVGAVTLRARLTPQVDARRALAQELVRARPDSGPAWGLLARTLQEAQAPAAEQEQAWTRAVTLEPQNAEALGGLAWAYMGTGQVQKALEPAKRAVSLAPGDAGLLDTYAAALFHSGHCPESLALQRRALESVHENASERFRQALQETLTKYERACTPAP